MKVFFALSGLLISAVAASYSDSQLSDWSEFKVKHGRKYESESDENHRLNIFMHNHRNIKAHNEKYEKGEVTYKLGVNGFTDMLHSEFLATMTGLQRPRALQQSDDDDTDTAVGDGPAAYIRIAHAEVRDTVDWRRNGAVTPIKDQGQCGSCWTFGATGALEGQHFRKTGKLVSLSEQNLVDCATEDYGNYGCDGGLMDSAFQYIKDNGGIDLECDYPYEAVDGKCRYKPDNNGVTVQGYCDLPSGDECALKEAVATRGPIVTAFDASPDGFQFYESGIFNDCDCRSEEDYLNHAVLVVGYGTNVNGTDYWICKNSWGEIWGDKGFFKIARNKGNVCGIATYPSFPLV